MNVWMEITKDEYQLPLVVADSVEELAEQCGATVNSIYTTISKSKAGIRKERFVKVNIDDEEE